LEVKAKFSIRDERTVQRLLKATALAGFSLEEPRVAELHDRYLDPAGGAFRAGGYACRIHRQDSPTLATLKALGAVSGAIHHRSEHQVELPETLSPRDWPQSAARDLALHLGSGEPLFLLFAIHQNPSSTPPVRRASLRGRTQPGPCSHAPGRRHGPHLFGYGRKSQEGQVKEESKIKLRTRIVKKRKKGKE
jgi:hypothetical protein